MSLDLGRPEEPRRAPIEDEAARVSDPTLALTAALESGARRIHIDSNPDGCRLRCRISGRLREVAAIPGVTGRALVDLIEDTARDGIGVLELRGGERSLRYRLAGCPTPEGKALVLTLLPAVEEPDAQNLEDLGTPEAIRSAISADTSGRHGLILVAGPPESGKLRTVRALAGQCDLEEKSLLTVTYSAAPPDVLARHPILNLDLRDELWSLIEQVESMDADWVLMPEIESPLHAALALALSGSRRLGIAPINAQDAAGALVKIRELCADRHRASRDLLAVLAQHRLPRPCPHCSQLHALTSEEIPETGWEPTSRRQLLVHAPQVRGRGSGCNHCRGSSYAGWTYLFEYLSISDEVADRLRGTVDPGRLREELKALTAGRGMMDAAWREVLRGTVEPEEILNIPGPEVIPFSLSKSRLSDAAIASVPRETGDDEELSAALAGMKPPAGGTGKLAHELYRGGHEILQRAFALIQTGSTVDPAPIEALASEIVTAAKENVEIVQLALTENSGNDIQVQQINVAILAARIGLGLQWSDAPPHRLALASLIHAVGLLKVPPKVLNKPGKLNKKEKELVRRHPEWAEEMVRDSLPRLRWLPRVIRQIHERESGSGYPDGVTGDEIDPLAKVIGLADALEALTHPRPWRPALLAFDAIQLLMEEHARDFDPQVFRVMVRQISLFPVGSLVQLNNGSVAQVISINAENFYRPKVEMVWDAQGNKVAVGHMVDLSDSPFLYITEPVRPKDGETAPEDARR